VSATRGHRHRQAPRLSFATRASPVTSRRHAMLSHAVSADDPSFPWDTSTTTAAAAATATDAAVLAAAAVPETSPGAVKTVLDACGAGEPAAAAPTTPAIAAPAVANFALAVDVDAEDATRLVAGAVGAAVDQVAELTATVRALKLRMSSLAKLLDEAVARRQKLEEALAAEKETGRGMAVESRRKLDDLAVQRDGFAALLETAQAEGETAAKELADVAVRLERKLEARLTAAARGEDDAMSAATQRVAEAAAARATQVLADATAIERTARGALSADQAAAAYSAASKAASELKAATTALDAARGRAAAAEQQLQNQNALLIRVDLLVAENGGSQKALETKEAAIHALNKEVETLRASAAANATEAVRGAAAAEAAEEKIADRVSQTLAAAETCVSTAEKVKREVERNAAAAAKLAVTQVAAAVARAETAETNLARSHVSLEHMTTIATQKEAVDVRAAKLALDVAAKTAEIEKLAAEGRAAAEAAAMWESKSTSTAALLETRAREVAEAMENIHLRSVQITAAAARADHAEASLRRQTELLDEMAEMAALKEAAHAKVEAMEQHQIADALEIEALTAGARVAAAAAAMWEGKATAADATVEARALAAEGAARAAENTAAHKMAVLEQTAAAVVGIADDEAVAAAVAARIAAINADADFRVHIASRDSEALRRALSASAFSVEVWRERAQLAAADLSRLEAAVQGTRADGGDTGSAGGRIAGGAFSSGADLRAFVSLGPRISTAGAGVGWGSGLHALAHAHASNQVRDLNAVGIGPPVHGRYDRVDKANPKP